MPNGFERGTRALSGGGGNRGKGDLTRREARAILRCTQWIEEHPDDIAREVWEKVLEIMRTAPAIRTRLHAAQVLANRFDPEPRPQIAVTGPTQVNVTWQAPSESNSPTPPAPSSDSFTVDYADGTSS